MKLYIWDDPVSDPYGGSTLFVAANNLREARKLAKKSNEFSYGMKSKSKRSIDVDKVKPSRVKKLPYAEYQSWSM